MLRISRYLPAVITAVIIPVPVLKIPHSWILRKCLILHWLTLSIHPLDLQCKMFILTCIGKNLSVYLFFSLNHNMRPFFCLQHDSRASSILIQTHQLHTAIVHQLCAVILLILRYFPAHFFLQR